MWQCISSSGTRHRHRLSEHTASQCAHGFVERIGFSAGVCKPKGSSCSYCLLALKGGCLSQKPDRGRWGSFIPITIRLSDIHIHPALTQRSRRWTAYHTADNHLYYRPHSGTPFSDNLPNVRAILYQALETTCNKHFHEKYGYLASTRYYLACTR